jgi:hypothetical protein
MSMQRLESDVRTVPTPLHNQTHAHVLPRGAEVLDDGSVSFRFRAPAASVVFSEVDGVEHALVLEPRVGGRHELTTEQASSSAFYQFILPDGKWVPDPASRYQVLGTGAVADCGRTIESGEALVLAASLSNDSVADFNTLDGDILWHEGSEPTGTLMRPWTVRWFIAAGEGHELP